MGSWAAKVAQGTSDSVALKALHSASMGQGAALVNRQPGCFQGMPSPLTLGEGKSVSLLTPPLGSLPRVRNATGATGFLPKGRGLSSRCQTRPSCWLRAPRYLSLGRLTALSALVLLRCYSLLPTVSWPCHFLQPAASRWLRSVRPELWAAFLVFMGGSPRPLGRLLGARPSLGAWLLGAVAKSCLCPQHQRGALPAGTRASVAERSRRGGRACALAPGVSRNQLLV